MPRSLNSPSARRRQFLLPMLLYDSVLRMWHTIRHKLWRGLPWDGQGLFTSTTGALTGLRSWAAKRFWQRTPLWSRPLLIPVSRLGWAAASVVHVWAYARSQDLPRQLLPQLLMDCMRSGARPNEALIWRQFFIPSGLHPLPGRAAGRVLSQLGSPAEHALLRDKKAAAERLARAGLPVPPLVMVIPRGQAVDLADPVWSLPGHLFIKPRRGSASRRTIALDVLAAGFYRINDASMIPAESLRNRLSNMSLREMDDLLVQTRLFAAPELADLVSSGTAPVLRLTTARNPGEAPFLHGALLSIDVPGEAPRHFIRGQVRVPINVVTGSMASGIWFLHPGVRYDHLPWNQAQLIDRSLSGLHKSVEIVLQAMALFPCLPLVNWDLILTPAGPVILEGNTGGDWILTNLSSLQQIETVDLAPLLRRWAGL